MSHTASNGDASSPGHHDATHLGAGTTSSHDVAAAADAIDEIANFWPPDTDPRPSESSAKSEEDQHGSASNLAAEAARYDPFKGTDLEHNRVKSSSSRQYSTNNAFHGAKGYPPQMAVFPGQNASRDISQQQVSALRTPDASVSEQEQQSNEFAEIPQDTGDRAAVASHQYSHDGVAPGSEYTHDEHSYHQQPHSHEHHHHQTTDTYGDASQADLTLDSHGALGTSTPHDMSMDADMSSVSAAGVKRKKNYKYLQDEPPLDASGQRQPSEKRKKVQKACRPCKRSHMPCQEQRPCPRCVKRGIPELCVDAEPMTRRPRKYGLDSGADESTGDASEIQQLAQAAAAAAQEAGDVTADSFGQLEEKVLPLIDIVDSEIRERIRKLMKTTEEDILDQFATMPLMLLAHPDLTPSEDASANQFEEQASAQSSVKYSYTRSYSELAKWALSALSAQGLDKLEETIKDARSAALHAGLTIQPSEVRDLEVEFQHTVSDLRDSIIEQVPVPMLVCRRSGEIYAVNRHASERFGLPQPTTNDPVGNIIQLGHEKTNLRIAELLLQSQTKSIGSVVSGTIGCRPKATDKTDKKFVISLESRQGKGGIPLLTTVTLTPLESTS